jgi:hypothetical protein
MQRPKLSFSLAEFPTLFNKNETMSSEQGSGLPLTHLCREAFGLDSYSSVSSVVSRIKEKVHDDRRLHLTVEATEHWLNMSQEQT